MSSLALPPRLASASVVFFGRHGDITTHSRQRNVSRQRLYREANTVLRDLDASHSQQTLACLQQQVTDLKARLASLEAQQPFRVLVDPNRQAEFVSTCQAEGVSLPVARRLLAVFLVPRTPSVPQLGRFSRQAASRAGPLLEVFDE